MVLADHGIGAMLGAVQGQVNESRGVARPQWDCWREIATTSATGTTICEIVFAGLFQTEGDLLAKVADAFPEFAQAFRREVAKSISFTVDIAETRTLHLTSGSIESLGTCFIHVEDAKRLSSWYPVSSGSQEFDTRGRYPKHSV